MEIFPCSLVPRTAWISPGLWSQRKLASVLTKLVYIQTNTSPNSIHSNPFYWQINVPTVPSLILFFHCPLNKIGVTIVKTFTTWLQFPSWAPMLTLTLCYNQSIICCTLIMIYIFFLMSTWSFLFVRHSVPSLPVNTCHPVQLIFNAYFVKIKPFTRWDLSPNLLKRGSLSAVRKWTSILWFC